MSKKFKLDKKEIQKYAIITCMCLACAACIWWIFKPSAAEIEKTNTEAGLKMDIPDPSNDMIFDNKKDAYEREFGQSQKRDHMLSLDKYVETLTNRKEEFNTPSQEEISIPEQPASVPIESSVSAYSDLGRSLNTFYAPPANNEQEILELTWRIQELEKRLEEQETEKDVIDQQFEIMERSYQLASKYMPNSGVQNNGYAEEATTKLNSPKQNKRSDIHLVQPAQNRVVSFLAPYVSDSIFIEQYSQPRNLGFHTVGKEQLNVPRNTIRACVHQTTTLTNGGELQLRLQEALQVDNIVVPINSIVIGKGYVKNDRLQITVSGIEHEGYILPVSLEVYDNYGSPGLLVPGSDEVNAIKEIVAGAGNNLGSTITISQQGALEQLGTDLGRGLLQGSSQYMSKKLREVKVTVKANHKVLLVPTQ